MTDIRILKEKGERYFPQTHKQAVIGLSALNINSVGVFLVSENEKKWQLVVDDEGNLSTEEIVEVIK
ncbi:hypothetical protein [Brochothrix campestris]|uniref:Uncharacterized protein n=1 Tax=Brochothrix campestris FSL F6-1037 TaxID=1265861 RepID=W7CAF7_9LIST|nr:hypothetical protein [Brochothrix campestris]EUJ34280.1 hypothetical protein BCAMP_12441 [Brochothrix campestris FSL F6-1037]